MNINKPIIEIKNLGKKYNITHQRGGYVALRDVLMNVIKSPFSFIKSKAKQVAGIETKEEFWALKDINLEIQKGEVIGIIGSNGAGKSTLLKILSQITPPTTGEVKIRGRVGSLLEVGTGFHPELTGRENIFLNGAILGMTRVEMARKFDDIVEFAGIEKFLDTQVKHYSSGMYVRLAFSVAAHLEPDILIVDEVLAVGDAEFQKKCLGKMEEVTKNQGRTILFVSHNMAAIERICSKTILLKNGNIIFSGDTEDAISKYRKMNSENNNFVLDSKIIRRGDGRIKLTHFQIEDNGGNVLDSVKNGSDIKFVFFYKCNIPEKIKKVDVGFSILKHGVMISKLYSSFIGQYIYDIKESGRFEFKIKNIPFAFGRYEVTGRVLADGIEADWPQKPIGSFEVIGSELYKENNLSNDPELSVTLDGSWFHESL